MNQITFLEVALINWREALAYNLQLIRMTPRKVVWFTRLSLSCLIDSCVFGIYTMVCHSLVCSGIETRIFSKGFIISTDINI